jgi:dynein heavy chain 1
MEDISDGLEFLLESGQGVALSTATSTEHATPSMLTPDQMMHLESYAKQSLFKPVLNNILENPAESASVPSSTSRTPHTTNYAVCNKETSFHRKLASAGCGNCQ